MENKRKANIKYQTDETMKVAESCPCTTFIIKITKSKRHLRAIKQNSCYNCQKQCKVDDRFKMNLGMSVAIQIYLTYYKINGESVKRVTTSLVM